MFAHITDGTVDQERPALPDIWRGPDRDWDLRDADDATMHAAGWWQVVDTARPADTATATSDRSVQLVDGIPTVVWTVRDWTSEELTTQAEQDARLDDLTARVARIEAHLWPAPDDPTNPDDATVGEFTGVWPDGGLIREDGTIWRNVSGVPLTTPPSGFPGAPSAWERLFVAVISEPTEPTVAAWVQPLGSHDAYSFGAQVTFNGHLWKSNVAGERTNTWKPGVYGWDDLGVV